MQEMRQLSQIYAYCVSSAPKSPRWAKGRSLIYCVYLRQLSYILLILRKGWNKKKKYIRRPCWKRNLTFINIVKIHVLSRQRNTLQLAKYTSTSGAYRPIRWNPVSFQAY